tara:strand:+ start:96 stop:305 length:210 start_codon:yes stop_codon:yes gene_type:complete
MDKIKNYFKRLWYAIWASTEIDEKAALVLKEAKARLVNVKKAATTPTTKKKSGKKPYNKNKKTNNNSKK